MESTGVYWKRAYYVLEDAFECWLLNAQHLHHVPGGKTDVADAAWIAQLVEHDRAFQLSIMPIGISHLLYLLAER